MNLFYLNLKNFQMNRIKYRTQAVILKFDHALF